MASSTAVLENSKQLINGLKELQEAKYESREDIVAGCYQTSRVLDHIFDLGAKKTEISSADKAVIGPLLDNSLISIDISVEQVINKYRHRLDTNVLRKRSALQFLIDDFGDYPTNTPGKKFSANFPKIMELIEALDDLISTWKGSEDPDDPDSDRDEANILPASHTWWKD